ncbi:MAG TPA: PHP domain-containing protein, partial [Marmoricola sp.]|nr:PHP domain-containing protein [Marmoricola sp.]
MPEQFTHLHVASSYSLRFGASHPDALVERAAEHGMDSLALTDRDGVYGAVRFVNACQRAGISPILGADLAVHETGSAPFGSTVGGTPAKGGRIRDQRFPRVTFLASSSRGWAALCRLISAAHAQAAVNQGQPVCTPELLTKYLPGSDLLVLLGPASA